MSSQTFTEFLANKLDSIDDFPQMLCGKGDIDNIVRLLKPKVQEKTVDYMVGLYVFLIKQYVEDRQYFEKLVAPCWFILKEFDGKQHAGALGRIQEIFKEYFQSSVPDLVVVSLIKFIKTSAPSKPERSLVSWFWDIVARMKGLWRRRSLSKDAQAKLSAFFKTHNRLTDFSIFTKILVNYGYVPASQLSEQDHPMLRIQNLESFVRLAQITSEDDALKPVLTKSQLSSVVWHCVSQKVCDGELLIQASRWVDNQPELDDVWVSLLTLRIDGRPLFTFLPADPRYRDCKQGALSLIQSQDNTISHQLIGPGGFKTLEQYEAGSPTFDWSCLMDAYAYGNTDLINKFKNHNDFKPYCDFFDKLSKSEYPEPVSVNKEHMQLLKFYLPTELTELLGSDALYNACKIHGFDALKDEVISFAKRNNYPKQQMRLYLSNTQFDEKARQYYNDVTKPTEKVMRALYPDQQNHKTPITLSTIKDMIAGIIWGLPQILTAESVYCAASDISRGVSSRAGVSDSGVTAGAASGFENRILP